MARLTQSGSGMTSVLDVATPFVINFDPNIITFGYSKMIAFSVLDYPSSVETGWLIPITRLKNAIFSIHIGYEDTFVLDEEMNSNITYLKVKLSENTLKDTERLDIENQIRLILKMSERLRTDNSKAVNVTISVLVFGLDQEDLDKNVASVMGNFTGNGFILRTLAYMQQEGWRNNLPASTNEFKNMTGLAMPLDSFVSGLPFFANSGLTDEGGFPIGRDSYDEPIMLDIWKRGNGRENSNLITLGGSGSGKSAFTKALLYNQLAAGDRIVLLDAENEYVGIAEELRANILDAYGGDSSRINPLQLRDIPEILDDLDDDEIDALKNDPQFTGSLSLHVSSLKGWFKIYIPELTQLHLASLEKMLFKMYKVKGIDEFSDPREMKNTDFPIMSDLYRTIEEVVKMGEVDGIRLNDHDLTPYKELLLYLDSAVNGADRGLFNGHTTIDLNRQFNVFNVHRLLEAPENVKNAQFHNLTTFTWIFLTRNKNERTILVVDEAHLFIDRKNPTTFAFLGSVAKRIRKYMGSLWIISQNVMDFLHEDISRYGNGILNNPSIRLFMKLGSTDIIALRELMGITESEERRILSAVHSGLMIAGNQRLFAHIEIEPNLLNVIERTGGGR